jgi:hypothetical protein
MPFRVRVYINKILGGKTMTIKIKIDGRKYVACKECGVYYKSQGGKKKKKICTRCPQVVVH